MKRGLGNIMMQTPAMQENLRNAQAALTHIGITGNAGGRTPGVANEMLEDLLAVATIDANATTEKSARQKMAGKTAGIGIPGLNLLF